MKVQSRESIHECFNGLGIDLLDLEFCTSSADCIATPYVLCSHESYPGIEAHLFTAADAALWIPHLTSNGNVVIFNPLPYDDLDRRNKRNILNSWSSLCTMLQKVMQLVSDYIAEIKRGHGFSGSWIQQEDEWFRGFIEGPDHGTRIVDEFIEFVDTSIKSHIRLLNRLGFGTTECCSGIPAEHPDREPYPPYVMFDERAYPGISAHLYTLANAAGWIPSPGRHDFDITLSLRTPIAAESKWDDLSSAAENLEALLRNYKCLVSNSNSHLSHWRRGMKRIPNDVLSVIRSSEPIIL